MQHSANLALVQSSVNVALGRENVSDALRHAGTNFLFDVVGRVGANRIGQMYRFGHGEIDYLTHKALHGMLGSGLGALRGDALAGAIGATVGEIVAEAVSGGIVTLTEKALEKADELGIEPGTEDFVNLVEQQAHASMNWGKLGAAVSVALADRDVNVALDVATNGLENNFAVMVVVGVMAAAQGLAALNAILTTADGIEAYEKDGLPGVLHLMQEDTAMALSTGGLGKPTLAAKKLLKRLGKVKANHVGEAVGSSARSESLGRNLETGRLEPKGKERVGTLKKGNDTLGKAIREEAIPEGSKLEYLGPGKVRFNGVEFKAVRDLGHLSEIELRNMLKGRNPIDIKGTRLDGHHHQQRYHREPGAFIAEIPDPQHCISNSAQHPLGTKGGLTETQRADWNKVRVKFNKERASAELLRRKLND